jgi:hypothetical protein
MVYNPFICGSLASPLLSRTPVTKYVYIPANAKANPTTSTPVAHFGVVHKWDMGPESAISNPGLVIAFTERGVSFPFPHSKVLSSGVLPLEGQVH